MGSNNWDKIDNVAKVFLATVGKRDTRAFITKGRTFRYPGQTPGTGARQTRYFLALYGGYRYNAKGSYGA